MRKFKLIKGNVEYDLMSFQHFFNAPDGLGFDISFSFLRSGESFIETESSQSQKTISGEIVFGSYAKYSEFINFIGDNEQMLFAYMPEDVWHYLPIKFASVSKTELEASGRLISSVTMIALGTWYSTLNYTGTSITIQNGAIPSPFKIEVSGAASSFTWSIGNLSGSWTGTLTSGQKLVIDTNPESMQIAIYQGATFVSNEYVNCDFETERFFFVPSGTQTMTLSKSANVEVKKYAYSI